MNHKQRIFLQGTLWPNACQFQGWDKKDRALRLSVVGEALGRVIESTNEVGTVADFSAVRRHLEGLAGVISPHEGVAESKREKVLQQIKCLALYVPDATGYVRGIIRDKFRRTGAEPEAFQQADAATLVDWLSDEPNVRQWRGELHAVPSQLQQLMYTLQERLNAKGKPDGSGKGLRNQAGHTLHDMYTKAGLQCDCKMCSKNRRLVKIGWAKGQESKVQGSNVQGREEEPVGASGEEPF